MAKANGGAAAQAMVGEFRGQRAEAEDAGESKVEGRESKARRERGNQRTANSGQRTED